MLTAQHSRRGKAECRAARQVGAQYNARPQRQRKQRLLRREGERQPGAGHLLGIQRVDKEEYGQPPLCPAGKKVQRIAYALAQLHGHSPPSCHDMRAAGSGMPPILRAEYKPYHIGIRQIPQGYMPCGIKNRFPLCRVRTRDKISLLSSISVHQCFSGRNRFGKQCFFAVWQPCV